MSNLGERLKALSVVGMVLYGTFCILHYPSNDSHFIVAAYLNGGVIATVFAFFEGSRILGEIVRMCRR